jgi:hypothetical protein
MNRRQLMKTTFNAVAAVSVLRPGWLAAQQTAGSTAQSDANTIYLNPGSGADTNSGAKASPLRTLVEAARRVNQMDGTGAMTIILSGGLCHRRATVLKPERRSFSRQRG